MISDILWYNNSNITSCYWEDIGYTNSQDNNILEKLINWLLTHTSWWQHYLLTYFGGVAVCPVLRKQATSVLKDNG